ncbi:hypothetical protein Glove_290g23 [Diversispora epigaea]|uniref:Uncharacterized protein n=1 Tax=Diversispora epigaea TaxID=1348612 RepID=A0A397I4E8_9GLOM|nr:hypothetical protein Glove_290g23 [Diversispora epigaea]
MEYFLGGMSNFDPGGDVLIKLDNMLISEVLIGGNVTNYNLEFGILAFGILAFGFRICMTELHVCSAKIIKSLKFSGIVLVNTKTTRYSDGLDVWHMEVAGPSNNAINDHIVNDTRKTLCTNLLNLVMIM